MSCQGRRRGGRESSRGRSRTRTDRLAPGARRAARFLDRPGAADWKVTYRTGAGRRRAEEFDKVLSTASLHSFKEGIQVVRGGEALPAAALPAASYSPLSVVAVGFKNEAIGRKLQGTHILVPQGNANMRSNCVLFSSDAFKGRAPGGSTLFTLYFGGTRPPFRAQWPRAELLSAALQDLQFLLQVEGPPTFARHVFWKRAVPIYTPDYGDEVLRRLAELEAMRGLHFAGNHVSGLDVGSAVTDAYTLAGRLARRWTRERAAQARAATLAAPEGSQPLAAPAAAQADPLEAVRAEVAKAKAREWGMEGEEVIERLKKQRAPATLEEVSRKQESADDAGGERGAGRDPGRGRQEPREPPEPKRKLPALLAAFAPRQEEPAAAPALSEEEQRKARREQALKAQKLVEEDVALQLLAEKEWSKLERAKTRAEVRAEVERARKRLGALAMRNID